MSTANKDSVLIVSTSASRLGEFPTGLWLEELAAPYYIFKEAGFVVTIASVKGGPIPVDAKSLEEGARGEYTDRFEKDAEAQKAFKNSIPAADILGKKDEFSCIYVPGGHGIVVDGADPNLKKLIESFNEQVPEYAMELLDVTKNAAGKVVGSVCHGAAALLHAEKPAVAAAEKVPLVQGEQITGFSDAEEEAVQLTKHMPYSLEGELKKQGAHYEKAPELWKPFTVTANHLVTGQNPQSSEAVAHAIVKAVKSNPLYVAGIPVAAVT